MLTLAASSLSRLLWSVVLASSATAEPIKLSQDPFRQLEEILPTPTTTRAASGAPGAQYWQQEVDYEISVELDDEHQRIIGAQNVNYVNHSPDTLKYLWFQLDANAFSPNAPGNLASTVRVDHRMPFRELESMLAAQTFDGSSKLSRVQVNGKAAPYTVVQTMMRVDLPEPLAPGGKVNLNIAWSYAINDSSLIGGRTGYEYFEKDKNYLYEIAQWFPRLAAYHDSTGWQHKQFLGRGEFTLEFGDYDVKITVPSDHVVAATGVLQNPKEVLSAAQRERLKKAEKSRTPLFIVTPDEAKEAEKNHAKGKKTWHFAASNVRDFAFASSRKFIWDAKRQRVGSGDVWAMSYYPKEAEPLWSRYSTHSVIHTLDVYSRYTFDYPYPVAISVNGPIGGMEYPMICFNGPRPEEDGTYSARTKYGLISVVIHEVGHNFFPMIVNSDERQWTWMDEGLNTFLQYLAEQEWEPNYPSRRGEPRQIVDYMSSDAQVPIMTNSESILQFGNNAYGKPATALNILRETILGRELFDFAFKEYATRWKFRRPMPADFFRTMEDASGIDLDWFWRSWFYTTDHVDIAIDGVQEIEIDTRDPEVEKRRERANVASIPESQSTRRNAVLKRRVYEFEELKDFYNRYDPLNVTPADREEYKAYLDGLDDKQKALLATKKRFYVVNFSNLGGIPMPILVRLDYVDGSNELIRLPAEIWRLDTKHASKLLIVDHEVRSFTLDPYQETADTNLDNNSYPPAMTKSKFQLFKEDRRSKNPMQLEREWQARDKPRADVESGQRGAAGK